ncbi:uncharacterized protein redic1 isoform X2 [Nelusetta ayraudi]|uniref:uncharacterized protein redic1 isoform X2 n=1 Tax=Nelusetta ayraudi TaxID=303726 RepID=UPI003F70DDEE
MNWVGGSRNRLVMKNDAKRQREFFEKRKMQQRLKTLGLTLPQSPQASTSCSMDLVTLFIVNQIATKKENNDPPKVAALGSCKGNSKCGNDALVLPMSNGSPSQQNLVEGKPNHRLRKTATGKGKAPQMFKYPQLSPVLESAFSDNSASDYLPGITDSFSPFSSTSTSPSGQDLFPLQLRIQQRRWTQSQQPCGRFSSPPTVNTPGLPQPDFQPFSQPRAMMDSILWSTGSDLSQMGTPTAARCLFRSPVRDNTNRQEAMMSGGQPEKMKPVLDFTLNQSENEPQLGEVIFSGFCAEERETEETPFGRRKKIFLKETPVDSLAPQMVPDKCKGIEPSNGTDLNFSSLENHSSPASGCDWSPSFDCGGGYLSSDSIDVEEHRQVYQIPTQGSEAVPEQRLTELRHNYSPDCTALRDKAVGSDTQGSQTEPRCQCRKTPGETREVGTQTANRAAAKTCDASTQCGLAEVGGTAEIGSTASTCFDSSLRLVVDALQHPSTGRQRHHTSNTTNGTPLLDRLRGKNRGKTSPK